MSIMPIKIAIGCSNHLYGEGLKRLLEEERDVKIIGIFNGISGQSSMKEIMKLNPDVILTDQTADLNFIFDLPEEILKTRHLKLLLIGDRSLRFIADKHLKDLVIRGVVGILPPSADSDLLKKALKAVTGGELWLDRTTLMKLIASMRYRESVSLGKREKEIIFHICQGYRNKEIAQKLSISEQTVKSHCNRIYRKIGVSDRLQLALYSFKLLDNTKVYKLTKL